MTWFGIIITFLFGALLGVIWGNGIAKQYEEKHHDDGTSTPPPGA